MRAPSVARQSTVASGTPSPVISRSTIFASGPVVVSSSCVGAAVALTSKRRSRATVVSATSGVRSVIKISWVMSADVSTTSRASVAVASKPVYALRMVTEAPRTPLEIGVLVRLVAPFAALQRLSTERPPSRSVRAMSRSTRVAPASAGTVPGTRLRRRPFVPTYLSAERNLMEPSAPRAAKSPFPSPVISIPGEMMRFGSTQLMRYL